MNSGILYVCILLFVGVSCQKQFVASHDILETKTADSKLPVEYVPDPVGSISDITECGKAIEDTEGTISFRLGFPHYQMSYRCTWVIQTPRAESFYFKLTEYSPIDQVAGLAITMLNRTNGLSYKNYNMWDTNNETTLSGDVAIVTFYSGSVNQWYKFQLSFQVNVATDSVLASPSAIISPVSSLTVEYPGNGVNYTNNALAIFVYSSNFLEESWRYQTAVYNRISLESGCNDKLLVFGFINSSPERMEWEPMPQDNEICGDQDSVAYEYDDMMMFIFFSDDNNTGRGFTLQLDSLWVEE